MVGRTKLIAHVQRIAFEWSRIMFWILFNFIKIKLMGPETTVSAKLAIPFRKLKCMKKSNVNWFQEMFNSKNAKAHEKLILKWLTTEICKVSEGNVSSRTSECCVNVHIIFMAPCIMFLTLCVFAIIANIILWNGTGWPLLVLTIAVCCHYVVTVIDIDYYFHRCASTSFALLLDFVYCKNEKMTTERENDNISSSSKN